MKKLHIRRNFARRVWTIEQDGQMVDCTPSFAEACAIAAKWYREGWYIGKVRNGR